MGTVHAEWLNQNALRAYPFSENCQRRACDGQGGLVPGFSVPNYLLVDFVAVMPAHRMDRLYMSQMTLAGGVLTAVFSAVSSGDLVCAAVCRLSRGMGMNAWTPFSGSGDYADVRGAIVVGDVDRVLSSVPDGVYAFQPSETTMEARCVRPSIAGVSSLSVAGQDGARLTGRVQGDVSLIAGENIRLSYDPELNAIWIDADPNDGYVEECDCGDSPTYIATINGISSGNVDIVGGDCVKVEKSNGRIVISDTCSKPCCGCEELTWLSNKANEISTAVTNLRGFAEKISDRMDSIVDAGMINGTLSDRDRYIPHHEVDESLRGSPNWSVSSRNEHLANHGDELGSRIAGQHADYGKFYG